MLSAKTVSILQSRFVASSVIYGRPANGLTRRANHGHNDIIAKVMKARAEKSAAGFLLEFSNRTAAARHDAASPSPSHERRQRAAVRTLNSTTN